MKKLLLIIKLLITSGILYYIFTVIPFSEVITSITSAKVSYIIFALLITPFTLYLAAYQMRILVDKQGMFLSTRDIIEINLITKFYSLFLPGSLSGGAIKWYKFSKSDNKPAQALASIAFNRLIQTMMLVFLGILFLVFSVPFELDYMIGLLLVAVLIGLLVTHLLVFDKTIFSFLRRWLSRVDLFFVSQLLRNKVNKLLHSITQFHTLSRGLLIYIYSLHLIRHLLGILSFYLFALSLGIDLSFINVGWVRSFVSIVSMLPISFAGFGVREGTLVFLLEPYGISAPDAIALSFLLFARLILTGGIGGLFEAKNLFLLNRSKSEVKELPL